MAKHGKKYLNAVKLVDRTKVYSISEAANLLKEISFTKFAQTVEVSFNLNIDAAQADQQLRGVIALPHGTGKTKRVLAITGTKQDDAKAAGADFVGFKDLVEKIQKDNWFDYDVIVATPDAMGELSKLGKLLGPKGLMPNPKTGTVSMDIAKAIKEIKAGKVEYRNDKQGNVALAVGLVTFTPEQIAQNVKAVCDQILKIKPAAVKGTYVKSASVSLTMSPSIRINPEIL